MPISGATIAGPSSSVEIDQQNGNGFRLKVTRSNSPNLPSGQRFHISFIGDAKYAPTKVQFLCDEFTEIDADKEFDFRRTTILLSIVFGFSTLRLLGFC